MLSIKNIFIFSFLVLMLNSCDFADNNKQSKASANTQSSENLRNVKVAYYGKKIDESGAVSGKELKEKMGNNTALEAKVRGEIIEVCKEEGCWLTIDMEDGTTMQINMQDHAFFVPKDIAGRTVIAEGKAVIDTTSVADLRHFAEDAGKSEAEIEAITDPETQLTFDAVGVIVK